MGWADDEGEYFFRARFKAGRIDQTKNEELLKSYKPNFEAGMTAELIAEQIAHAVNIPENANISEIIIRPNA